MGSACSLVKVSNPDDVQEKAKLNETARTNSCVDLTSKDLRAIVDLKGKPAITGKDDKPGKRMFQHTGANSNNVTALLLTSGKGTKYPLVGGNHTSKSIRSKEGEYGVATESTGRHDNFRRDASGTAPRLATGIKVNVANREIFEFRRGALIGKGPYGNVYKALGTTTGQIFAVKVIELSGSVPDILEKYERAIGLFDKKLKRLSNKHIVRYHDMRLNASDMCLEIVTDYVTGGPVLDLCKKLEQVDEHLISKYVKDILEGLQYLHDNNVIHGNLKGSNALLSAHSGVKLSDICLAEVIDAISDNEKSCHYQNPNWSAPEVFTSRRSTEKCDIWSVGALILELITGEPPWAGEQVLGIVSALKSGMTPKIPGTISHVLQDFLARVFVMDPKKRATIESLISHDFTLGNLPPPPQQSDAESSLYSNSLLGVKKPPNTNSQETSPTKTEEEKTAVTKRVGTIDILRDGPVVEYKKEERHMLRVESAEPDKILQLEKKEVSTTSGGGSVGVGVPDLLGNMSKSPSTVDQQAPPVVVDKREEERQRIREQQQFFEMEILREIERHMGNPSGDQQISPPS